MQSINGADSVCGNEIREVVDMLSGMELRALGLKHISKEKYFEAMVFKVNNVQLSYLKGFRFSNRVTSVGFLQAIDPIVKYVNSSTVLDDFRKWLHSGANGHDFMDKFNSENAET